MNEVTKYMKISLVANFFLSVLKIVMGLISNMKSLIADGIHSFTDLSTDIIAIIGNKLSEKPADEGHPRGHGNIEYITSLIISCFIIGLSFSILKNSFNNTNIIPNIYMVVVVVITIIVKYFLSYLLIKKGKKINSMILISSGKESYTDVFSSFLVFIVIIASQFSYKFSFLKYSDMLGSVLISIMIFTMGIKLLIQNLSLLIGESETREDKIFELERLVKERKENFILDDYTIFKLGSYYDVSLKILVDGNITVREGHNLMDNIESDLLKSNLNIKYVTIHIEPIDEKK